MNKEFLTTAELSQECGIAKARIYKYVTSGQLNAKLYVARNKQQGFLFSVAEVEKIKNLKASFEKFCEGKITVKEAAKRIGCSVRYIFTCRDKGYFTIHIWHGFPYLNKMLGLIDVNELSKFRRKESDKLRRFYSCQNGVRKFRDYFTASQAAEFLNVSRNVVINQIKRYWLKDKTTGVVRTETTKVSKRNGFCYLIPRSFVLKLEKMRDEYLLLRQDSLTVAEAMKILNYSKQSILKFIETGKLRATKMLGWPSTTKGYLIARKDLNAFMSKRSIY